MRQLEKLIITASPDTPFSEVIEKMAAASSEVIHRSIAAVIDESGHLLGVVNDGDIRRAVAAGRDLSCPVSEIMIADPVTVPQGLQPEEIIALSYKTAQRTNRLDRQMTRHVLVVDEEGRLSDVIDFIQLLSENPYHLETIAVFGMGFVGLTLAVTLAIQGHAVTGIDIDPELIERLSKGVPHILEPGLQDALAVALENGSISFQSCFANTPPHNVFIIAVGTPLHSDASLDRAAISAVAEEIGKHLHPRGLVMLRSTVAVATTRDHFIPILESRSGLTAGRDFAIAFTPERTVEGNAMRELRSLPQIVGGLTHNCTQRAANFWSFIASSVVRMETLEAAEIVKLANNSFRDLSFAFANELALLADRYNFNAFQLIEATNEGYPRNRIPVPSPGVGGYCLTKDPFLLGYSITNGGTTTGGTAAGGTATGGTATQLPLGNSGRAVNHRAGLYPFTILERFASRLGRPVSELTVFIAGLAFKGWPETNDLRGSVAVDLAEIIAETGAKVLVWDAVVPASKLASKNREAVADVAAGLARADAMLIMNNHQDNVPGGLFSVARSTTRKLIFDGWNLLDSHEIESIPNFIYATMGYMTPAD